MVEQHFQCPYCWENISMLVDVSLERDDYIEDCEVCCNPIQIEFVTEQQEVIVFRANSIEQ
ncbi:MAG: CPXCG motif-containing cysteine-rich protein [Flavobacteriaceae bacterium]